MHKKPLRHDKTCRNCGATVEGRYCPQCGQENVEHRDSFPGLVAHFAEDLTHYDGKFWASLKLLFFRPGRLTGHYLGGKVNSYLPPVKMYIFVSFITFLLPNLLPEVPDEYRERIRSLQEQNHHLDTGSRSSYTFDYIVDSGLVLGSPYKTMQQLDSARSASYATDTPMTTTGYFIHKKAIDLRKYTAIEIYEKFEESLARNFPKTLFFYMPLFALIIRLFHRKRNWIYFDHAIFTLHYFSFMLLAFSLLVLLNWLLEWACYHLQMEALGGIIFGFMFTGLAAWFVIYFYRAHRVVYRESWTVSTLKATGIYLLNLALFVALFFLLAVISIWLIH